MAMTGISPKQLDALRHTGWRGQRILPHRAFRSVDFGWRDPLVNSTLVILLTGAWLAVLPSVGELWFRIYRWWHAFLGMEGSVAMAPQKWGAIRFSLPTVLAAAGPPDLKIWISTAAVTLLAFWVSFGLGEEHLPWAYLLRFVALVQGTALAYFAFAAARFPHDLPSYLVGMLYFGAIFTTMLPLILGFSYFLFDFSLLQKLALTLCCMAWLTIFLPFQYMLHAWIIHASVLFMPILYFMFGPFLDVLVFVSLYSWGMSWRSESTVDAPPVVAHTRSA
jgi:hypothetical protein